LASTSGGDGGACYLLASSYPHDCMADSDCQLVPPGGDVCNSCNNGTGCLYCNLASIRADAASGYLAALHAAEPQQPVAESQGCWLGSCPSQARPVCVAGECALSDGSSLSCGPAATK
jgi:hypothetical protein